LSRRGLEDVKTELIDTIYIHRMRDVAIGLDDAAAIETWDEPSPRVVEYLATTGCQNKCSWTSIDFIRRVVSDDTQECPLTLVIGTEDSDNKFWWLGGIQDLKSITEDDYMIIIRHMTSWELDSNSPISPDAYNSPPRMGASIGQQDVMDAGTLEGFVKIRSNGQEHEERVLGLTNHHLAIPEYCKKKELSFINLSDAPLNLRPMIVSPAESDHREHLNSTICDMSGSSDQLRNVQDLDTARRHREPVDITLSTESPCGIRTTKLATSRRVRRILDSRMRCLSKS
jgi:hypothetical protein